MSNKIIEKVITFLQQQHSQILFLRSNRKFTLERPAGVDSFDLNFYVLLHAQFLGIEEGFIACIVVVNVRY